MKMLNFGRHNKTRVQRQGVRYVGWAYLQLTLLEARAGERKLYVLD